MSEKQVREYWSKHPKANIGLVTGGKTGVVIDLDERHKGVENFTSIIPGNMPATRIVRSPGGYHLYFQTIPNLTNSAAGFRAAGLAGIDVRGDGSGYIVAPPSVRADGCYTLWCDEPLAVMPRWLRDILFLAGVSAGMKIVLSRLERDITAIVPNTGMRHDVFLKVARVLGQYVAGKAIVLDAARAQYAKLVAMRNTDNKYSSKEIDRLFDTAMGYGKEKPISISDATDTIVWVESELPQICDKAAKILASKEIIFSQWGSVIEVVPGEFGISTNRVKPYPMRSILTRDILWVKPKKSKEGIDYMPIAAPLDVAKTILDDNAPALPALRGFAHMPHGDTNVRGYNRESGFWLDIPEDFEVIPMSPEKGLEIFRDLLQDFPFVSDVHLSAYLSLILTCCFRQYIEGPVPLFIITSPVRGTGKGKLADIASIIATGYPISVQPPSATNEELGKNIISFFRLGGLLYSIDDVSQPLGGDVLNSLVTSDIFQGRILGMSELIRVRVRMIIIATGNNVSVSGDMDRRILPIHIDSKIEHPEYRKGFAYPEIIDHVKEYRQLYMSAAIALRGGKVQDKDRQTAGSFNKFMRFVGDVLPGVGLPHPIEALRKHQITENDEVVDISVLLANWHALFGSTPITWSAIVDVLNNPQAHNKPIAALRFMKSVRSIVDFTSLSVRSISRIMGKYKDRPMGGCTLRKGKRGKEGAVWYVQKMDVKEESM